MKIAVIGAGKIGGTLAKYFVEAGHEVAISNANGPASLDGVVKELGAKAYAKTVEDAAKFGEIIVLAVPFYASNALPSPASVKSKIVIDAMNPYREDHTFQDLSPSTSSEETCKRLPQARIVKAFNTLWCEHLKTNRNLKAARSERQAVPVAGDDPEAKNIVIKLIEEIGFAAVDSGTLRQGGIRQGADREIFGKFLTVKEIEKFIQ